MGNESISLSEVREMKETITELTETVASLEKQLGDLKKDVRLHVDLFNNHIVDLHVNG